MSTFPLYTTLISNLPERDITLLEKKKLLQMIETLDEEGHELIFALIKSYQHDHGNDLGLPYKAQIQKDSVIAFNLMDLPPQLRRLLFKFAGMHSKKLEEDQQKQSSSSVAS